MMKRLTVTLLILGGMFIEVQAKEPTIDETVAFIQTVLKDNKKTADEYRYFYSGNSDDKTFIWSKPDFNFKKNNCNLELVCMTTEIQEARGRTQGHVRTEEVIDTYFIDLSKSKLSVHIGANGWDQMMVSISDRDGIKNIKHISTMRERARFPGYDHKWSQGTGWQPSKTSKYSFSGVSLNVKFYGVYEEKMKKAFEHLANKCYETYGVKSDDPF